MAHRFFLPDFPQQGSVTLEGDQAHHATQVMRFEVGDLIVLFNGQGAEASCEIITVSKKRVELTIIQYSTADRSLSTQLTMAVALPKNDRQKFLIEKLVELGVARLIPVQAERSVAAANKKVIERINKQIVEACKQCERNRLMEVTQPMTFEQIKDWSDLQPEPARRWIADPYNGVSIATVNDEAIALSEAKPAKPTPEVATTNSSRLALRVVFRTTKLLEQLTRVFSYCGSAPQY